MEITQQCVVALTWTLKDTLGEELDVLDDPVEFLVGGEDLTVMTTEQLREARRDIGMVFQAPLLLKWRHPHLWLLLPPQQRPLHTRAKKTHTV